MQTHLEPQTCNRPVYRQKGYKMYLSCHFSVKTHGSSTLQQKLRTNTNLIYLRVISNGSLSPNIEVLFKRGSSFEAQTGLGTVGNRCFTNTL